MSDEPTRDDTVNLALLSDSALAALTGGDLWGASDGGPVVATKSTHHKGDRLDRYELVKPLGQGAFAEVWLAVEDGEHGFRKRVALKILKRDTTDEDTFEALLHEARVCGHLHHANIVDVYGVGQSGQATYIAMEYIEGIPLDIILKKSRRAGLRLPLSVIIELASQVAAALDHAHKATDHEGSPLELVHRDLKPSNIIVSSDGVAKVTDFGLAKTTTSTQETEVGMLRGTPSYVAPEVWMGTRDFSPTIDLFALGAILWEMAVGELLFKGELPTIIGAAVNGSVEQDLQMLRLHQPSLSGVTGLLLQRQVAERTQTAREVCDALGGLAAKHPGPGGLRLFMNLAEALIDEDITLDESVSSTALSGDEDWQRFAARLGVGSDGAPLAAAVPGLEASLRKVPGSTRRQRAAGQASAGGQLPDYQDVSDSRSAPGSTRTFTGSRSTRLSSPGSGSRDAPPARPRARKVAQFLLFGGLVAAGAVGILKSLQTGDLDPAPIAAKDASLAPEGTAEPLLKLNAPGLVKKPATASVAALSLTEGGASLRAPGAAEAKRLRAAEKKAARVAAAKKKAALAREAEQAGRTSSDLTARSPGTVAADAGIPALKQSDAVEQMGCIYFTQSGLTGWVAGKSRYNPGLPNPFPVTAGVHEVEQGIDRQNLARPTGKVRVRPGLKTEVNCTLQGGGSCRVTLSDEPCP